MLIAIFGESCTGKSTLADRIAAGFPCEVFTGKDYLRLAKNENIAKVMFHKKLAAAVNGENILYVISEKEHLCLLPEGGHSNPCDSGLRNHQSPVCPADARQSPCARGYHAGKETRLLRYRTP